jgi:exopolysaccharide biosynthesis protein
MKLYIEGNKLNMKRIIYSAAILLLPVFTAGQSVAVINKLPEIEWNSSEVTPGIVLKSAETRLFDSFQAIYIIDIDTTAGNFEFGVAVSDKPLITSVFAPAEGVVAAINGTFFNMQEGYNVHYVRVNDSVMAVTDEKEFGIRATGIFTATGESVDIAAWGPEREDAGAVNAEDAIVSGPLLMDERADITLDSVNFNKNRHPRSLLAITADGHVLFIAVDGRQPGYAEGMSLFELRELARSLGCIDILNLDGGGSTTLYVAGKGVDGVVNKPSGKVERPVPSIVFVKKNE